MEKYATKYTICGRFCQVFPTRGERWAKETPYCRKEMTAIRPPDRRKYLALSTRLRSTQKTPIRQYGGFLRVSVSQWLLCCITSKRIAAPVFGLARNDRLLQQADHISNIRGENCFVPCVCAEEQGEYVEAGRGGRCYRRADVLSDAGTVSEPVSGGMESAVCAAGGSGAVSGADSDVPDAAAMAASLRRTFRRVSS